MFCPCVTVPSYARSGKKCYGTVGEVNVNVECGVSFLVMDDKMEFIIVVVFICQFQFRLITLSHSD